MCTVDDGLLDGNTFLRKPHNMWFCNRCDVCDVSSCQVYRCLGSDTKPVCFGWLYGRTRVCRYRMCTVCWQKWYLEQQKVSCPQCRREHTFPWLQRRLKQKSSTKVTPTSVGVVENMQEPWWGEHGLLLLLPCIRIFLHRPDVPGVARHYSGDCMSN